MGVLSPLMGCLPEALGIEAHICSRESASVVGKEGTAGLSKSSLCCREGVNPYSSVSMTHFSMS